MIHSHELPQKSVFKADEVCEIVGIKPYILRFWESEFTEISSIISSSGKKLFEQREIILISIIKELLFEKKLTIEKAKLEISQIDFFLSTRRKKKLLRKKLLKRKKRS